MWQVAPVVENDVIVNFDFFQYKQVPANYDRMEALRGPVLSDILERTEGSVAILRWPESFILVPVFDKVGDNATIVATLASMLPWHNYFKNLLPDDIEPIVIVVRSSCGTVFSYQVEGPNVTFIGDGDRHDRTWSKNEVTTSFTPFEDHLACKHTLHLYPSTEFYEEYVTNKPVIYTGAVIIIFCLTALVFVIYDCSVEKRQFKVLNTATRSTALVSSLFPANVQDRIMDDVAGRTKGPTTKKAVGQAGVPTSNTLEQDIGFKTPLGDFYSGKSGNSSKPIADLFPNSTVLFADIVGFTAWSSVREPTQVFTLLENIYNAFDKMAKKRKVFKVEVRLTFETVW
jgi:hypothetical protein